MLENKVLYFNPTKKKIPRNLRQKTEKIAREIAKILQKKNKYPILIPPTSIVGDSSKLLKNKELFGGMLTNQLYFSKAIVHNLFSNKSTKPKCWIPEIPKCLKSSTLPGFTVFSKKDFLIASEFMFKTLPKKGFNKIRAKETDGKGGFGQKVLSNTEEAKNYLDALSGKYLNNSGLVLEADLPFIENTLSIGTSVIANITISYFGFQHTTKNNDGEENYGGSTLFVCKGKMNDLMSKVKDRKIRIAIKQAESLEKALRYFKNKRLTRRNYDVIQGYDHNKKFVSALLEQSWRIGGATPAEIEAIKLFHKNAKINYVKATSKYVFTGKEKYIPKPTDSIYFSGKDYLSSGYIACIGKAVPVSKREFNKYFRI